MSKGDWSWIRQEAAQRGMTIPQLASYLGVTPQAVNYWANNRNDPDFLNIVRLVYTLCDGSLEVLASRTGISLSGPTRRVYYRMLIGRNICRAAITSVVSVLSDGLTSGPFEVSVATTG